MGGLQLAKKLTSRRTRNFDHTDQVQVAQTERTPVLSPSEVLHVPKTVVLEQHSADFNERIMQASRAFLRAKSDGKKV